MKICNRCNTQLNDNEQFCLRCGGNQFRLAQQQINRPNTQGNINNRPQQRNNLSQRPYLLLLSP